jgi:hypothetical protein
MIQGSNERQTHQIFHLEVGGTVDTRGGKQLRFQRIQGDAHSPSDLQKMALSGPDTPGFLFLGVCEANRLQCSYSQHSTLKQRIREVVASVTPDVFGRVWQEMEYRLDVCRATSGAHIEL